MVKWSEKKLNKHMTYLTSDAKPEQLVSAPLFSSIFCRWNQGSIIFPCDLPQWHNFNTLKHTHKRKFLAVLYTFMSSVPKCAQSQLG